MLKFPLCSSVSRRILADIRVDQAVADSLGNRGIRLRCKAESNRMTGDAKFHDFFIAIIMLRFFRIHDAASKK